MKTTCPKCGAQADSGSLYCPACGAQLNLSPVPELPKKMKWFRFIIYFQLIASAFLGVLNSVLCFAGMHNARVSDTVYGMYPALRSVDLAFAVCSLVLAVFALYVRQQLAHYRKNAPKKYMLYLAAIWVCSLFYNIAAGTVLGKPFLFIDDSFIELIAVAALLKVSMDYFKNRAHLFTD